MENHTFSDPVPVKDASSPTWKVDVIRLSGSVLVGTLMVNNETLPPRKNKKKIAWRLPDDPEALPKFGEHERKRLWELFKEQKKERRRMSKKLSTQLSSDGSDNKDEEETERGTEEKEPITLAIIAAPTTSEDKGDPDDSGGRAPSNGGKENGAHTNDSPASPSKENSVPPPPPGFNLVKMTLDNEKEAAALSLPSAPPLHTSPTPPLPPPGLGPTSSDPTLPPMLYFTLADDNPLAALGGLVVPLFLQCVTSSNVAPWLAHSHPTLSQTTLSLGSAQATGRTYLDRLQQWQSLTASTNWDCTGCVSQTLPTGSPPTVLLVLTGRTIQKQECLAYHLSIVLTAAVNTRNFQITNECLSLTALTNVPFPT
eukprot:scaffold3666_cov160-Amphora_coffeaeformis.AAC.15